MESLNTQMKNNMKKYAGREKLTVLIADKRQVNAVLENNIMEFGNRVIVAECYNYAVQAATKTRSDLITIGMNLPPGDSKKIILKIKEVVGAGNVVSTDLNYPNSEQKEKIQQTIYYIVKPLEVYEIQSILENISRKKIVNTTLPN